MKMLKAAIQQQYYWAYTLDVCLLAAGYNMPSVGSTGSGIYLGRQGPLTYVMAEERGSFMLQSYVPKQYPSKAGVTNEIISKPVTTKIDLPRGKEELNSLFTNGLHLLRSANVVKTKQDFLDVFTTEIIFPPDISKPEPTVLSKFTIPFKVEKSLCQNTLCCTFSLRITVEFSRTKDDCIRGDDYSQLYYRLGVFDGVKNYDGAATGGLQTCAIIPCITGDLDSCGLRSDNLSAIANMYLDYYQTAFVFDSIEISGNISLENAFVGPNVLLKGQGETYGELLFPDDFTFTSETVDNKKIFLLRTLKPTVIVTASVYGRLFSRDGSQYTKIFRTDFKWPLNTYLFDMFIFTLVTTVVKLIS